MVETIKDNKTKEADGNNEVTDGTNKDINDLKDQVADLYAKKASKKNDVLSLINNEKKLKNFFAKTIDRSIKKGTNTNLFEKINPGNIVNNIGDKLSISKMLLDPEIKSDLDGLKTEIETNGNNVQQILNDKKIKLENELGGGNNENKTDNKTDQNKDKNIEIQNGKRKDVLDQLDKIVKYDKKKSVKYARGGSDSLNKGLDCSGLIKYTLHQASIEPPGLDSKDMFQNTTTTKLEMNQNKGFINIEGYQPGDLLFRNTTNSKYNWKNSKISKIKKEGKEYRIHHVAFIKEIYPDTGKITIVESNGKEGLIEREIDYDYELNKSAHKSEIFAGKVNYDQLLAYNGTKENIDDKLAA